MIEKEEAPNTSIHPSNDSIAMSPCPNRKPDVTNVLGILLTGYTRTRLSQKTHIKSRNSPLTFSFSFSDTTLSGDTGARPVSVSKLVRPLRPTETFTLGSFPFNSTMIPHGKSPLDLAMI